MKFEIFNWAGDRAAREAITALGYENRQIVEGEVIQVAQKFLDANVNVMILNASGNPIDYVLAIDSKSFGQR